MRFTEGNTFIFTTPQLGGGGAAVIPSRLGLRVENSLLGPEHDPGLGQIIRRQLNRHLVPGQDADIVHTHLAGDESVDYVPVFQFDLEGRIGEVFNNLALHFDEIFFRHVPVT